MVHNEVELTVSVRHWRFEDGVTAPNHDSIWKMEPAPRGWYCWAYPNDNRAFESWMDRTCPTAEYQHRFNSGDPMYTVQIWSDKESTLFQLAWVK